MARHDEKEKVMGVKFQSNVSWGGSSHGSGNGGNGGNGGSDVSGLDFLNDYSAPAPVEPAAPAPVEPVDNTPTWVYNPEEEQTDYLGDQLVSDMSNEEVAAATGQTYNPNTGNIESYTPPSEIYGPGQATPGETGYAFQNISPSMILALGLDKIDPETAAFFGYTPGSTNVPNELYQQYIQGSIVSGNEAVETAHHYDTGTPWASGDPLTYAGQYVGTWDDLTAGEHPLFPGGLSDYYADMNDPFTIPTTGGGGGGWGGWGSYGGYGGGGGGGGGGYYGDPRKGNPIDRYGNFYTPQANLQQAMVNVHGTPTVFKKRGGIVSLLRL